MLLAGGNHSTTYRDRISRRYNRGWLHANVHSGARAAFNRWRGHDEGTHLQRSRRDNFV